MNVCMCVYVYVAPVRKYSAKGWHTARRHVASYGDMMDPSQKTVYFVTQNNKF